MGARRPPWVNRDSYEKCSLAPLRQELQDAHVISGYLDFRCPVGEGLQLFTDRSAAGCAQQDDQLPGRGPLGLEAGRTIAFWHAKVFGWLKKYVRPRAGGEVERFEKADTVSAMQSG